jgi:hypothetical protein
MALSRKQKREIAKLKTRAADVWDDQKDVIDRANKVIREASKHAGSYTREELAPRAQKAFDERVRPAVSAAGSAGYSAARSAAHVGRARLEHDVIPAFSSAVGSALAVLEVAKDPHVREALKRASDTGSSLASKGSSLATKAGTKAGIVKPKPSHGAGRYILIGLGVVAAIGVAYAAWQTLRADDDLWIDDEDVTEPTSEIQPS